MTNQESRKPKADFLIKNASQLCTPLANSEFLPAQFACIEDGAIAAYKGEIVLVGQTRDVEKQVGLQESAQIIDANKKTVTPGLIDCHTHPIFHDTRELEFEMRIQGKSYEEIALSGGGIRSSVRSLRLASKDELIAEILPRLDRFLALGTTTIEAKSGYGLNLQNEIKSLEVIVELSKIHALEIIPTFLGAHEIPDEYRGNKTQYIDLVINEMLPYVKERNLAEFCDIFCESHVFTANESRHVLQAAKALGFKLKIHAEQLTRNGGASIAAELNAVSADHLEYSTEDDWREMLKHKVVPVLLPGAVFFLRKDKYAPAQQMLKVGLPVAVATDYNPGSCMTESLPLMMTLSCLKFNLLPSEALSACTYHAALALKRGNLLGTLEVGKKADIVIWDIPNYKHIAYHFGVNLTKTIVKSGKVVWQN